MVAALELRLSIGLGDVTFVVGVLLLLLVFVGLMVVIFLYDVYGLLLIKSFINVVVVVDMLLLVFVFAFVFANEIASFAVVLLSLY